MTRFEKTLLTRSDDIDRLVKVVGSNPEDVDQAIAKERQKALKRGHMIIEPNGDRVWRTRFECLNSGRNIWHEDGVRVRCELKEITMSKDGESAARVVRIVWAAPQ
tara:strand:- start:861 stop:1178 length:318 start_codon:yes stop_codon:yes gene_type:complete